MTLAAGTRLGPYEIVSPLGAGGMGEVYRARDVKLEREVALKALPAEFARDPERVARFEREAKVLASLNHPGIAAIFGLHEHDGTRFLAMELVPGEDLSQRLARGALPLEEAMRAAAGIAEALEAAHDHGVIHRDLKPANVQLASEGKVKLLDFGLAKPLDPMDGGSRGSSAGLSQSPTLTTPATMAGVILGTASYMSPEQARGQSVDRRTDIWAFGCVVYEMLTGARAFGGATVTDVLAAVVAREPDWEKLPAATPPAVRRLLRRCLEKDARKRLRDAGDARLLLEETPEEAKPALAARARPARARLFAAIGLALAIGGVAAGWWIAHRDVASASSTTFRRLTFARGMMRSARFAPDGRTIVYGAAWGGPPTRIHMVRTDAPETAPIPVPPGELLSISRSGEIAIALGAAYYGWMADGTLARTSLMGGAPREILAHVRAADWSPDGSQLAIVHRVDDYDQLEYPIGNVLDKTTGYFGDIRISPDGERVAYTDHPAWGDNRGGLAVVDRNGKKTMLASGFSAVQGLAWAPNGREVWYTTPGDDAGGALLATDLSGHSRVVYRSIASIELFDIASNGQVLLSRHHAQREVLAMLAGYPSERSLVVAGEASMARGITADGRAVLVANQMPADYETFAIRADRTGAVRLTSGEAIGISPDGAWAMTGSADYKTLFVTPLGMGPTRTIPNPDGIEYLSLTTWLPDGRRFIVAGHQGSDPSRGFVCDIATGAGTPFGDSGITWPLFSSPPVSPDGKYAVFQDASGKPKQWPIDGGEAIPIPGTLPEDQPLTFTEDGTALFVAGRSLPISIERLDLATGRRTPWMTLTPTDPAGLRYAVAMITPSGKHWTLSTAKLLTDLYLVEGLR